MRQAFLFFPSSLESRLMNYTDRPVLADGTRPGWLKWRSGRCATRVGKCSMRSCENAKGELAGTHVRYGYRRLTVLLRWEGWHVKCQAEAIDCTAMKACSCGQSSGGGWHGDGPMATAGMAARPNQCWSMDFVSGKLADGRSFRILTVVDQFTGECVALHVDRSVTGRKWHKHWNVPSRNEAVYPRISRWTTAASSAVGRWKPVP
jgi:hypothetical protein